MAYTQQSDGTIIINGFENGIADDPYKGLADMRNVNIISIPGEASVNFKTLAKNPQLSSGSVSASNSTDETVTVSCNFDQGQAVVFAGAGLTAVGIVAGTTYWVTQQSSGVYYVWTDVSCSIPLNITGNGTGTVASINMGYMKYFTKASTPYTESYFGVDSNGRCWTDMFGATWRYTGNSITTRGGDSYNGAGIACIVPSDILSTSFFYIFIFSAGAIDYLKIASNSTISAYGYGWKPGTGTGQSNYLKTGQNSEAIHETLLAPDNVVYYCDSRYVGRFYENLAYYTSSGTGFDPTNTATYIYDQTPLLPSNDFATCLAFLGTSVMIGGRKNVIYPWNTTSPTFDYPLMIAESYISKMITINTNTFILAGNRGRIYYTNGTQAQLFKKIPDHISGTVEPYFKWGGIATTKNQLYFSASVTNNAGTAITAYGGVWAIDVDTKGLRMSNKLSYNTYAGYGTAIIPITNNSIASPNPGGAGLYIGWDSGASTYGLDKTDSSLYSAGETIIDSDYIPIGTVLKPTTSGTVEFKLATPLVSGDTVKLQYRQKLSDSFADITTPAGTTTFNTVGIYSGAYQGVNFQNSQWLQIRAVLTSNGNIATSSFVRLTEIRLK